jgi:hypothetical protein
MEIQEVKERADNIFEHVKDYIEARYNLAVLETSNKVTDILSSVVAAVVVGVFGLFVLFFLSFALAWWIGESLNSPALGFLCVAVLYAAVGGLLYAIRKKVIKLPVMNALIKKFYYGTKD